MSSVKFSHKFYSHPVSSMQKRYYVICKFLSALSMELFGELKKGVEDTLRAKTRDLVSSFFLAFMVIPWLGMNLGLGL